MEGKRRFSNKIQVHSDQSALLYGALCAGEYGWVVRLRQASDVAAAPRTTGGAVGDSAATNWVRISQLAAAAPPHSRSE